MGEEKTSTRPLKAPCLEEVPPAAVPDPGCGDTAPPEVSKPKEKAAAPTSNTEMGLCSHFLTFEEDMVMFISKLRSSERAPRCEHYLCANKVEKSSILVCIDCNLHFCIGDGTRNKPQGHARWHADMGQQHCVGAFFSEPETLYCFICERRLELDVSDMESGSDSSSDMGGCEHFFLDEEEFAPIVSEVTASKNVPVCQHPGCKITGKTHIMVCTGCNKHFCTTAEVKKRSYGHARQHAQQCKHWLGLWYSHPYTRYCFMCDFSITPDAPNVEVGMVFGKEALGHASGLVKEHVCPIRGMPNLGNTCYMNALLQCLFVLGKLRARMLAPDAPSGILGVALKELFEGANNVNNARHPLNPTSFLACLRILYAQYVGSDMHDSHELLCFVRDQLNGEEKLMMPAMAPTVVDSIFGGQISLIMSCRRCSYSSSSHEVIYDLSAPLPSERPPQKGIASAPRNISFMYREKTRIKLFPEVDMSSTEIVQAIAEGRDSHITGLELGDVAIEKISEPLEVDSIEVEQSSQSKHSVHNPSQTQKDNLSGDNAGLSNTSSEPEVSIEAQKKGAAEDKAEDNNSIALIEECLALHFKAELLEWNCENCYKAAHRPSTTSNKDGAKKMASSNENTIIDGDQTEQSDKIACQSEQSRNLDSLALESSSSKQPHHSDSQHQSTLTADSITEGISSSPPIKHTYALHKKTECCEGVQEAVPSCLPAEEPANQLSGQDQNASTLDQGEGKQAKLDQSADRVDENQKEQEDRNQGGIQTRLISKLPPVLAILLKRTLLTGKVRGHVSFGEILDVGQFMDPSSEDKDNSRYRLVGVIEHLGPRISAGHWIAYVRQSREQHDGGSSSWYCANDINIKEVSLEEVLKCEAHLLFYERIEG